MQAINEVNISAVLLESDLICYGVRKPRFILNIRVYFLNFLYYDLEIHKR